ncbi:hypothetical protein [Saccharophagus degradans]|uniref:DUF6933 domain-containing protein n=1 Tax=Saccharophagus degradans (strain 2-40 / ATCC 43961 / DSM 17024) TaxID=203122 RepID=Q21ED2_SACD2|nr:hypothetical protein [Saccharophagus degradans]ABD82947.1 hypothetical protein Sde_3692 [Saccharophagus degradans 2-40]
MQFTILFSASKAMANWLKLDAPRIPSPDGKRVGTQPLTTNAQQICWQCHVIENRPRSGLFTVLAVEAFSRYTLIIPYPGRPRLEDLENEILRRWANELLNLMIVSGEIDEADVDVVIEKFLELDKPIDWVSNTDLSVQGHASDAGKWVTDTLYQDGGAALDDDRAIALGLHINQFKKKSKDANGKIEHFYPMERMLDDALFRFASGLAKDRYEQTRRGDFPNPFLPTLEMTDSEPIPSNVVQMANYRHK